MKRLTHIDSQDRPRMVDVTGKPVSHRTAQASGFIRLNPETVQSIAARKIRKGNVLVTAELAGVQAAKQTALLIPLCHPLRLSAVTVEAVLEKNGVAVTSEVKCTDRTGVEMEALTAVSIALLAVYDMCKAVDKRMVISKVHLVSKEKDALTAESPDAAAR
jgi:cyclic pyranopterin phosphate synthase